MKFNFKTLWILGITALVILWIRKPWKSDPVWNKHERIGMHTHIEVTFKSGNIAPSKVMSALDSLIEEFEGLFTETDSSHPLFRLSQSPAHTSVVLKGPVKTLFDFLYTREVVNTKNEHAQFKLGSAEWLLKKNLIEGTGAASIYSDDSLVAVLGRPYYHYDNKSGTLSLTRDSLHLTLGSVSKGYGIGLLAGLLERIGVQNYLINAGGDLAYAGVSPRGTPWRIGVRHPREPDSLQAIVNAVNPALKGLATSGDYENYRLESGGRIHHLVDARTGRSVSDKQSVTVLAATPLLADYYATFLFLLPLEELLGLVNDNIGLETLVTDSAGQIHMSGGMSEYLNE